ncbi:hypothetical protein [Tengunoibacter tsumagoiensis]|uniref:Uncharacterized protein n=1 Tax=Tengunoibacter tsumagoiensis TaxID=2014871 RepID=A0A402A8S7_9CHLR|nr:hypothetical protein [Tengunoibacter tsumagoiensis]GCE15519.1 hypothetical protein KTT_53780 [Tengunoibacter tsumagoiensis]
MTEIYLEVGEKKVFACAVKWLGWCRAGKNEGEAQHALLEMAERYRVIAERAGQEFEVGDLLAVERVKGDTTTDWGAPSSIARFDREPSDAQAAALRVSLLRAAWEIMDEVVAVSPAELRKGPRGGGRERDEVFRHVVEAERAYGRKIGVKQKPFAARDRAAREAMREEIASVLSRPSDGRELVENGWPVAYAARRIAWHVIDHIWEIEDRRI